ncbi:MAG: RNA polymerase sigma factor [Butyricicoccaceae bacterium]
MTLAAAITAARIGQDDGFAVLYQHTVASVYFTAVLSGCTDIPRTMVRVFEQARASLLSLQSPSDLRQWKGHVVYSVLEDGDRTVPKLSDRLLWRAAQTITQLGQLERRALLLTCADGCSAAQAADILKIQEIEVKRAVRRARKQMEQAVSEFGVTVNTAWLMGLMQQLQTEFTPDDELIEQVRACVMEGKELPSRQEIPEESGFFARLFRAKRT